MKNPTKAQQRGQARTNRPERSQIEFRMLSLDDLVRKDDRVRLVWLYCESLDLTAFYKQVNAREGEPGRTPIDPTILFALWFQATLEGITSARRLAKLTKRDFCYMWICGGVSVNHHTLSDFYTQHHEQLQKLLKDSITVLLNEKLISLETIGQDGMRVRASAGSSSFRSQPTLERMEIEAEKYLEELRQQAEQEDQAEVSAAEKAAHQRAAQERLDRIKAAQENLEELERRRQEKKSRKSKSTPRASTTDPEAVRMKMGDGGFRPAYNVQFATDGESRIVVGVDVNNQGSDMGQMLPVYRSVVEDYGVIPEQYLVDGGFTKASDIDEMDAAGTTVFGALKGVEKQIEEGKDPYQAKPQDSDAMGRFRERMGTPEAQAIYQQRPSIAEFPNAECRNRGLTQFRVRGQEKAFSQTLWHVLVNNFIRFKNLGFLLTLMGNQSALAAQS